MKHSIKILSVFLAIALSWFGGESYSQTRSVDTLKVYAFVVDGDTIPGGWMLDAEVKTKIKPEWKKYWREWTRLRNAIYVTYPYAKTASRVMNEINLELANVSDKKLRKEIIKKREKDLKKDFTDRLTNLSVYQGRVLMKLIYRETGNNCYHIIEEYKGGFTAGFWQTIALIFGSNLRQNYEPAKGDKDMEQIVREVERMYGYRS